MTWDEWAAKGLNGVKNECGETRNSYPNSITFSNGWVASIAPSFKLGYIWSVAVCDWNGYFDWEALNQFGAKHGVFLCNTEEEVVRAIQVVCELKPYQD